MNEFLDKSEMEWESLVMTLEAQYLAEQKLYDVALAKFQAARHRHEWAAKVLKSIRDVRSAFESTGGDS